MREIIQKRAFIRKMVICAIAFTMAVLFCGCGCSALGCTACSNSESGGSYLTRAEWITILGKEFSLTTYEQGSPYYSDVPSYHSAFTYVQSCYEWDVLLATKKFDPDKKATRGFIAETAVRSLLLDYDKSLGEKNTNELLQYAIQNGIIESGKADDKLTVTECFKVIENIKKYYLSLEVPEYSNISVKDTVVDYSSQTDIQESEEGTVIMPDDLGTKIKEGTVFIIPGYPYGTAVKATSVETVDGQTVIETVTPELEEVFDELEFSFSASPKLEDIIPLQEGITITPLGNTAPVSILSTNSNMQSPFVTLSTPTPLASGSKEDPLSFGVDINFTNGTLTSNVGFTEYFNVEAEQQYKKFFGKAIPKDAGEILKRTNTIIKFDERGKVVLEKTEKWTGGYKITGNLSVKNLYVDATGSKDLKDFSCELHFEIDSSLSIEGELEGSVPFFEANIRGPWGLSVKVVFSLYVDVNGELTVGAEIDHTTNITYKNKKFKTVQNTDFVPYISISADISSGIKGEAIPTVLGIQLFDVTAKAGADLNLNHTLHAADDDSMICLEGKASFPVVSISIGANSKTLANKLGIKATFKLIDSSDAPLKSFSRTLWHYEITANGAKNVSACTWGLESGKDTQEPTVPVVGPTTPGGVEPSSESLAFSLNDDGESYSVTGIGTCTGTDIVIPDTYNNLPVTAICAHAFYQNDTITSIRIPDSITTVEGDAIRECSALTHLYVGSGVQSVYTDNYNMVFNCKSLVNIEVSEDNPYFKTVDGNLMSMDGQIFVLYATGKQETSFAIPESVTIIGRDAFAYAQNLESVLIPNGVTAIEAYAFWYCSALESITIPDGVTTIGRSAFGHITALKRIELPVSLNWIDFNAFSIESISYIYYGGTVAQWLSMPKDTGWDKHFVSYIIYCKDGSIPKS